MPEAFRKVGRYHCLKVWCFSDFNDLNLAASLQSFSSFSPTEMNLKGSVTGVVPNRADKPRKFMTYLVPNWCQIYKKWLVGLMEYG